MSYREPLDVSPKSDMDLCPSCVKKRHRACDQPSHAEMRSNPVSTQARDAPCEGIYHLGDRAFLFLCLSPDSS